MTKPPKEVSEWFSHISRKRKNPHYTFNDPKAASEAGKLGAKKRWEKKKQNVLSEEQLLQNKKGR